MNIKINPGAATDDAQQIDSIVTEMAQDMETLDVAIKQNIGENGIVTTWAETVKANWNQYYGSDVPQAMEDMKLSATNLRLAVDEALAYDQERH